MTITELVEKIEIIDGSVPVLATIGSEGTQRLFGDSFENSNGSPVVSLSLEVPLPAVMNCRDLLEQLSAWIEKSPHFKADQDLYLATIYEYTDRCYDFRYFKLLTVIHESENILLIADAQETSERRMHFDPFDESLLDDDSE